jgi:5S rRNA maturation endonuclease (ribonuclease M5)
MTVNTDATAVTTNGNAHPIPFDELTIDTSVSTRFEDMNERALPYAEKVLEYLSSNYSLRGFLDAKGRFKMLNPCRVDNNVGSFSFDTSSGIWCDFGVKVDGKYVYSGTGLISIVALITGRSNGAALDWVRDFITQANGGALPEPSGIKPIQKTYNVTRLPWPDGVELPSSLTESGNPYWVYNTAEGKRDFAVERRDSTTPDGKPTKDFYTYIYGQHKDEVSPRWHMSGYSNYGPFIYGLDRLAAAPNARVIVVEGEKTCDALRSIIDDPDVVVITSKGGAGNGGNIDWSAAAGRDVCIIPDNDFNGASYADAVGNALLGLGCKVSIVDCKAIASMTKEGEPREPTVGWDLDDAIQDEGWEPDAVLRAIEDHTSLFDPEASAVELSATRVATTGISGTIHVAPPEAATLRRRKIDLKRKHKRARWKHDYDLLAGEVTIYAGEGGTGKSTALINRLLSSACARSIFGERVWGEPKKVLIINGEDNEEELEKRVHAAALKHGLSQEEVDRIELVGVDNPHPINLVVNNEKGKASLDMEGLRILERHIQEVRPEILVLDPLQSFCPADVIDGGAIGQLIKALKRLAAAYDLAVAVVHHPRKAGNGGREGITIDDIKGSSAITQHARVVKILRKMNEKEADRYSILPSERWRYFCWETVKHNLRPLTGEDTAWFKLESFDALPFEADEFDATEGPEKKQVLVRVDFGNVKTSHLTAMQADALRREVVTAVEKADANEQPYSLNPQGRGNGRYIGNGVRRLLKEVTGVERTKEDEDAILKGFIEEMHKDGLLTEVSKKIGGARKATGAVVVTPKGKKLLPVEETLDEFLDAEFGVSNPPKEEVIPKKRKSASKASKEGVKGVN